jgi:hypothetical protein
MASLPFMKYLFVFCFIILGNTLSFSQNDDLQRPRKGSKIIDDTTKQIYGPKTSFYFYEDDFFTNQFTLHTIDTAKWNFHRFNYVQRFENFYQDLGNIGTASRPVFEQVTNHIGTSSGFTAYDLYWDAETIKHFNTRSPYTNMKVVLGGKGRSVTRITFSRNIHPRWNFGFNYRVLLIDKQVQRQGKGDRHVKSNYYDLFTSYHTKDSTYSLFLSYRRNTQQADEYGGVFTEGNFKYGELFLVNAQPWLTEAESNERRANTHLFHQYKLGKGLQLYHKADFTKQRNRFLDNAPKITNYYDFVEVDSTKTRDHVEFTTLRNEAGVKGTLLKLYYNGYVAFRHYNMQYKYFYEKYLDQKTNGDEFYVGGRLSLRLDSLVTVTGWIESMLDERYIIQGTIHTKWFEAMAKRSVSTPSFLTQLYRGSHDIWLNSFIHVEGTEVKGNLKYESKRLSVYPGVRFTTLRNFIYFQHNDLASGQRVLPVQSSGYQTWVSPELKFSIEPIRHVTLVTQGLYTNILENAGNAVQLPKLFVNTQLAYANIFFKGNFDFQVGVDVHWKSAYYAPGYDIAIQQFYLQQSIKAPEFPIIDIFLNTRIKRARIFVKYNNLLKTFSDYANIPTPFYPGIRNIIDFGFDWSFYD